VGVIGEKDFQKLILAGEPLSPSEFPGRKVSVFAAHAHRLLGKDGENEFRMCDFGDFTSIIEAQKSLFSIMQIPYPDTFSTEAMENWVSFIQGFESLSTTGVGLSKDPMSYLLVADVINRAWDLLAMSMANVRESDPMANAFAIAAGGADNSGHVHVVSFDYFIMMETDLSDLSPTMNGNVQAYRQVVKDLRALTYDTVDSASSSTNILSQTEWAP